MAEDILLEVNNVDVYYGSLQVLWDISLSVKHGEIVAIIGANGAGKSTLINTISGVLDPAKGYIKFEGKSIAHLNPFQIVASGISQVPEGRRIFPDMTVLENLEMGSYNRNARRDKKQNLRNVFKLFPRLQERVNQVSKTLSGGEQQMLAIGRGLMSNPKLMLFDEISLGLGPLVINEIYRSLREIRNRGITCILVEQNVRRSLKEADRAYIMEAGHIVLSGQASELMEEERVKKAYFGT